MTYQECILVCLCVPYVDVCLFCVKGCRSISIQCLLFLVVGAKWDRNDAWNTCDFLSSCVSHHSWAAAAAFYEFLLFSEKKSVQKNIWVGIVLSSAVIHIFHHYGNDCMHCLNTPPIRSPMMIQFVQLFIDLEKNSIKNSPNVIICTYRKCKYKLNITSSFPKKHQIPTNIFAYTSNFHNFNKCFKFHMCEYKKKENRKKTRKDLVQFWARK